VLRGTESGFVVGWRLAIKKKDTPEQSKEGDKSAAIERVYA